MKLRYLIVLVVLVALAAPAYAFGAPPSPLLEAKIAKDPILAAQVARAQAAGASFGVDEPAGPRFVTTTGLYGIPEIQAIAPPVVTDSVETLVLLVDFEDEPAQTDATFYDDYFFADDFGPTSLRGYYREASYGTPEAHGMLDIVTQNSPSVIGWVRLPGLLVDYAGTTSGLGGGGAQMVKDAVEAVDDAVDFSVYDNNGDGFIENLIVVHAGIGAEVSGHATDIWSHAGTVGPLTVDGVKVFSYSTDPEYIEAPGDMTVGVAAHEFGHTLGLPDLYDTDGSSEGVGEWSLMGSGNWNRVNSSVQIGSSPSRLDPWSASLLGWLEPQLATGEPAAREVPAAASSRTASTWRLDPNQNGASKEYFLVENRQLTGTDAGLPGSGMLIWHIDESRSDNTSDTARLVDVEEAHGYPQNLDADPQEERLISNRGDAGDPFPGTADNRSFTDFTDPNARVQDGTVSHVIVDEISDNSDAMSALIGFSEDSLTINQGDEYTIQRTVRLDAYVYHAAKMAIDMGSGFGAPVDYLESCPVLLPSGDGTKTVTVEYYDNAMNPLVTLSDSIGLDMTGPTITSLTSPTHPLQTAWYTDMPSFEWSATDAIGVVGYSCVLDALSSTDPDVTDDGLFTDISYTDLPSGAYDFRVRAVDAAGNWSAASHYTAKIDIDAPESFAIVEGRNVTTATVELDATDPHSGVDKIFYSLDGADEEIYAGPFEVTDPGLHTVAFYAIDNVGNVEDVQSARFSVTEGDSPQATLAGADRFATAVAVSEESFPAGADTVLIATGRNWPDALGASALAGALDAPVLLTESTYLPESVKAEIERLGATEAIVIGGYSAISKNVETALGNTGDIAWVSRIAGTDRFDTATKIAAEVVEVAGPEYDGTVLLATGASYADALAASPIAAKNHWPILLAVPGGGLTEGELALAYSVGERGVILGGTAAVGPAAWQDMLAVFGSPGVTWIAGTDRYDTAAKIADWGVESAGMDWKVPGIATGTSPYDALSGGVAQGKVGSVLLLTRPEYLVEPAAERLTAHETDVLQVRFFGGPSALNDTVHDQVAQIIQ